MDNNIEILDNTVEVISAGEVKTEKQNNPTTKRFIIGKVVSNKADKTIIVASERQVIHPLYKKYFKRTKKVMAHDENNDCNIGDLVRIIESRPLSARKRWNLVEVLKRAK
jgi:small subunit ribosomal protein S17